MSTPQILSAVQMLIPANDLGAKPATSVADELARAITAVLNPVLMDLYNIERAAMNTDGPHVAHYAKRAAEARAKLDALRAALARHEAEKDSPAR